MASPLTTTPHPQIQEIAANLSAPAASIAPKFFYDALGSKLFEAITELAEYTPTRTEAAVFAQYQSEIASAIAGALKGPGCLIDLGAGNCAKAAQLMQSWQPAQYVPIDISADFLSAAAAKVQAQFPGLDVRCIGMDFSSQLALPSSVQSDSRVFFYPGSSLGNFHPVDALAFLKRIADPVQGHACGLLLGIDLVKDTNALEAAYDDALGVTAAFNKNVLRHLNSLIGSNFEPRQWRHVALFNASESRIEMHLEAMSSQDIRWPGGERHFAQGERIHTENSYKYTLDSITDLLRQAGFGQTQCWSDEQKGFGLVWARPGG
jgi:dimethylhistidine N-methyltransferase